MAGVVVMLLVAGLLEGLGRQLVTSDALRYAIGLAMLALWCGYFYLPRRRAMAERALLHRAEDAPGGAAWSRRRASISASGSPTWASASPPSCST